jgi:hypothetical protein
MEDREYFFPNEEKEVKPPVIQSNESKVFYIKDNVKRAVEIVS